MDFYFSKTTAQKPLDRFKRKYPTQLAYLPDEGMVIDYTAATDKPEDAAKFAAAGYECVAKGVENFAVLRTFAHINNEQVWRQHHQANPDQFENAIASHGLTVEGLLKAHEETEKKMVRKGRPVFGKVDDKPHGDVRYYPTGGKKKLSDHSY